MATRFYLSSERSQFTPTFDGSWEDTSLPLSVSPRFSSSPTKRNTPWLVRDNTETSSSSTLDALVGQFVSEPLAAQNISGDVKGVIRAMQSTADSDMRAQMVIRVLSYDFQTVRGTLLAHDVSALTSEFALTLTNRKFPLAWTGSGATLTSVAAQDGDRLVIEVGFRAHNTSTANRTGSLDFGDSSGSDLAEDEVSTTQGNPWIEFSATLTFLTGRTASRALDTTLITKTEITGDPTRQDSGQYNTQEAGDLQYSDYHSQLRPGNPREGGTVGGGGLPVPPGAIPYFRMRALASPGPGYVHWTVAVNPDPTGAQAPAPIQPGTAVIASTWVEVQ